MNIIITFVSDPSPNLNDEFRIEWRYDPEEQLEEQFVEITSLTLEGGLQSVYHGCPPTELRLPNSPDPADCEANPTFTNDTRVFEGRYTGPIQFAISARSTDFGDLWDRRVIELRDESSFFKIGLVELSHSGFPRMGTDTKSIDFLKFFGILNSDPNAESIVDDLASPPYDSTFLVDREFFGTSQSAEESDRFGFSRGSLFPRFEQDFLDTASITDPLTDDAIAVVFAGAIVTPVASRADDYIVRTDEGSTNITVFWPDNHSEGFPRHPVFAQIDIIPLGILDDGGGLEFGISNVKFGNPDQGLVLAAFPRPSANGTDSSIDVTADPEFHDNENGPVLSSNGALSATVVFEPPIVTEQGDAIEPNAMLNDIEWQNVPVYRDDRLLEDLLGEP